MPLEFGMAKTSDVRFRLRKSGGFSQVPLAAAVGITQSAITQIETGQMRTVSVSTLYELCDALEVNCDHFRPFHAEVAVIDRPAPEPTRAVGKRK